MARIILNAGQIIIAPAWDVPNPEGLEAIAIEAYPATGDEVVFLGSLDSLRELGAGILSMCDDLEEG